MIFKHQHFSFTLMSQFVCNLQYVIISLKKRVIPQDRFRRNLCFDFAERFDEINQRWCVRRASRYDLEHMVSLLIDEEMISAAKSGAAVFSIARFAPRTNLLSGSGVWPDSRLYIFIYIYIYVTAHREAMSKHIYTRAAKPPSVLVTQYCAFHLNEKYSIATSAVK